MFLRDRFWDELLGEGGEGSWVEWDIEVEAQRGHQPNPRGAQELEGPSSCPELGVQAFKSLVDQSLDGGCPWKEV